MAEIYDSPSGEIHPAGWLKLSSGGWITKMPVWEGAASGRLCRWGAAEAAAKLAAWGMRLPTWQELHELHLHALFIAPVELPTPAMKKAGAVPGDSRMSSLEWCDIHDREVFRLLAKAGWTGLEPVSNAGKHTCRDGALYGWWNRDGTMVQGLSYWHEPGKVPHVPPKGMQRDYATTTHAVAGGSSTPATPASSGGGGLYPAGMTTGAQMRRVGAVVGSLLATAAGAALAYLL